ncbi:MAG: outer membrane beta-barrel protein, partial [Polyangiales bacterium]
MRLASALAASLSLWASAASASEAAPLPSGDELPRIVPKVVLDAYYSRAFPIVSGGVTNQTTPARDDGFTLNLASIGFQLEHANIQGELILQYGSSVDALNPSSSVSPSLQTLRSIQTAWLGWHDGDFTFRAGVQPAHLGHESFVSTENWNYGHAIFADATPYFFTGLQLDWKIDPRLNLSGRVFKGWQTFGDDLNAPSGALIETWEPIKDVEVRNATQVGRAVPHFTDLRIIDDLVVTWTASTLLAFAFEAWGGTDRRSSGDSPTYFGGTIWAKLAL